MREIARELLIYQLVAVVLTLLSHPDSDFLSNLPGYLIMTNCIAWSIRTIFALASIRLDFLRWKRRWQILFGPFAVGAGCFIGLLIASLIYLLFFQQNILNSPLFLAIFRGTLPAGLIVTILILSYNSFRERLENQVVEQERLKSLQARSELAALQSKLNPHFLFNTLNTMLNLVHKEPEKVEEMILGLSDIYRNVLQLPAAERISLADEFALARQYLAIEQIRLGDRLRYTIDLPEDFEAKRVPPLLIQPLVENAVLHGISPRPGGGRLSLSAHVAGEREEVVRIVVEDDGVGIDSRSEVISAVCPGDDVSSKRGNGFGLHSTRERMRLVYGNRGALKIESPSGGGTRITLEIPHEH